MTTVPKALRVLDFWFGELDANGLSSPTVAARWWQHDPEFDASVKREFGDLYRQASVGDLTDWLNSDESALALVIVLDQFSRNLHRDTPQMVAQDSTALDISERLIERGADRRFPAAWRSFVYMPFMHSEDLADQNRCIELFEQMRDQTDGPVSDGAANSIDFAVRHRDIIARFNRFPHRNGFLDRTSSEEEMAFLQEPGSSF